MKRISASTGQYEDRNIPWEERLQDHNNKKTEFLENCLFRGCTDSTVKSLNSSLTSVFNRVQIEDSTHPEGRRHLVCFDVLDPLRGSTYIGLVKKRYALALLLLHCLYEFLRKEYLAHHKLAHAAARDYAAIVLQAETGLRVSELLAIRVIGESCDVDWGTGRIRVFGKGRAYGGKRIRWVPLSPMSIAVLKVFIGTFRPMFPTSCEKDYLFLDNNGRRFMPYQYARNFRKIVRLARHFGVLIPEGRTIFVGPSRPTFSKRTRWLTASC